MKVKAKSKVPVRKSTRNKVPPTGASGISTAIAADIVRIPLKIERSSRGVLPAAILGSQNFDVTHIDPASIKLQGVSPIRHALEDVTGFNVCKKTPDGYVDLSLKFDYQEIIGALGEVDNGDRVSLLLEAALRFEEGARLVRGQQTVDIISKKK